ncbi:DUF1902 domain-containing protein [Amycolatopsis sp. Hca4]|uniref:DUF1902 domain-containing protein n=1 Tax=Amycolatopsis sp. Hca4 TaxID=2742131 RepID=UPI001590D2DD|nr:DUF1902 domain-containing protein [Amycolatopsis sp. Hca4]QKV74523.1 DUF1902 domain-containing protein [Amycolatopsis sp. Hca4]
MAEVVVTYHQEDGVWWAETDAVPRFSAAAATYDETRMQVAQALRDILGDEIDLRDQFAGESPGAFSKLRQFVSHFPGLVAPQPSASRGTPTGSSIPVH